MFKAYEPGEGLFLMIRKARADVCQFKKEVKAMGDVISTLDAEVCERLGIDEEEEDMPDTLLSTGFDAKNDNSLVRYEVETYRTVIVVPYKGTRSWYVRLWDWLRYKSG